MWMCERWPTIKGRCQVGQGGRFSTQVSGDSVSGEMEGQVGGSKTASIVADVAETTFETLFGEERIGGEVHSMVWDPTGERLAVILRGHPDVPGSQAVVAVFRTRNSPVFELLPWCVTRQTHLGAKRCCRPVLLSPFSLRICWSFGRIIHYPPPKCFVLAPAHRLPPLLQEGRPPDRGECGSRFQRVWGPPVVVPRGRS
uniref:Aladin WD repeat nucleoporin n=1 Tax=Calidris pygmaea TaxID=425635 RepID=A0A8C3JA92_9CHAR